MNLQIVHKVKCPYGIMSIKENVHRKWNVHTTHWIEEWPYKIYWIGKCPYVWKKSILLDTLYLVEYTTEIFESWSFIANTTGKKVLSLNEYSKVFYQNPQSELFKVWMAFRCVDRDLWELKLYCKYYSQKRFILEWIFKCFLSKSAKRNLQGMNGL